jgi:hypothetical protein
MTPKIYASQGAYVRIALDVRSLRRFPPLYGRYLRAHTAVRKWESTDAGHKIVRAGTPIGLYIPALKIEAKPHAHPHGVAGLEAQLHAPAQSVQAAHGEGWVEEEGIGILHAELKVQL